MTDTGIPEAWPALMSRTQLRAYVGGIGDATLRCICPVAPVDLGANVLRYRKTEVDAWLAALPPRSTTPAGDEQDVGPVNIPGPANDPADAIARARARARG